MSFLTPRRVVPNPDCALFCPVLETDRLIAGHGNAIADEDFERHCAQSHECTGTTSDERWRTLKCPLFGVEVSL